MRKLILICVLTTQLFTFEAAFAQATTAGTSTAALPKEASSSLMKSVMLGLKSYNDSGRVADFENKDARIFKGKEELYFGYKHSSNWGSFVTLTQYRYEFNDHGKDKWSVSDPSLSLVHPDLYNDGGLTLSGFARGYLPYTDNSKTVDKRQWAYYFTAFYYMGNGHDLINVLTPRWFVQNIYKDADTTFYTEDRTIFNNSISKSLRWGVQQYTQVEQHSKTSAGVTVELIPTFDYVWSAKTFIGPRVNFPLYVNGVVFDSPRAVATDNVLAEIFFQTSL